MQTSDFPKEAWLAKRPLVRATGAVGEATVASMAQLPLLLIPAYLVPLFVMLHVTALIQARRTAQTER
jgi:hypothetical protein